MFGLQPVHLIFILVIALIVVGPGRLPDVGASLGKTIKEFRKAATDVQDATSMTGVTAAPVAAPAPAAPAPAPVQAAPAPVQAAPVAAPVAAAVAIPAAEAVAAPVAPMAVVPVETELVHPVPAAPDAPSPEAGA